MGGHGGLNILPQKKWNVYNYDNRDIVEKDKKEHAQKMQKTYESQRKHTIQRKFDVLKGQHSTTQQQTEQHLKQSYKADSILNHQFKRLAQQNQHVNLFQHEQKIIQNRQVLEYHKMKQAEWLKDKDMDYSSKFLGTYNDEGKMPWYAKGKVVGGNGKSDKLNRQRYDMEDLTDLARIQKLSSRKQYYLEERINQEIAQERVVAVKRQEIQFKVKRQSFTNQRQRSRNRKYEFIKERETSEKTELRKQSVQLDINRNSKPSHYQNKQCEQKSLGNKSAQRQTIDSSVAVQQRNSDQFQLLRLKRLKRQQKQRRKAEQLRRKLQQSINRN